MSNIHSKMIEKIEVLHEKYREDIVNYNYPGLLFYLSPSFTWLSTQLKEYYGSSLPYFLFYFSKGKCSFEHPSYIGPGEHVMGLLKKQGLAWVKKSRQTIKEAEKHAEKWLTKNKIGSGRALHEYLRLLQESNRIFLETHISSQIVVHIDRHLERQLSEVFSGSGLKEKDILELCIPHGKSAIIVHDKEILKFRKWCRTNSISLTADAYKKNSENRSFMKRLKECYKKGYSLHAGFGGVDLWTLNDEYKEICRNPQPLMETKPKKRYKLTPEQREWIMISAHFSELREQRKTLQSCFYFYQAQLLEEIARITGYQRKEIENLRIEQFTKRFLTRRDIKRIIEEQKLGYLILWEQKKGFSVLTGEEAIKVHKSVNNLRSAEITELRGVCASPGRAKGHVRIVSNPRKASNFKKGDILVTGMTSPDFVSLMKKAGAIVTEIGGVTCHAAIVSRELGIPCIIGTKIATKVLKDGQLVEVNANHGWVKIIKQEGG